MPASQTQISNNGRIAKNTIILYSRMLVMMIIGFFTSRLVLQALGVIDYGISNVVGGLVTMFTMISDTFSITIGRFLAFHLGRGDMRKLEISFSTSINIQILLSVVIVVLMETIGLWFLEQKLIVPPERMQAARTIFQLSVVTFVLGLICVPYNSIIISRERMDIFAYFGIFETLAKLFIAVLIYYSSWDKLIYFFVLSTILAFIQRILYGAYCTKIFPECKFHFHFDKPTIIEMSRFAGWNLLSSGAVVFRVQGTNIMLNLFFGPIMNAAKGVANQLNSLLNGFVSNFMVALNPQITKSFANKDLEQMEKLAIQGSKFSYFIFLIVSIPLLCNTHYIINLWLRQVPEHSVLFIRLIVIYTLLDTLSKPLTTSIYATGKIGIFQILISIAEIINIPASYFLLRNGAIPEIVTIVNIIMAQVCLGIRVAFAHILIGFNIKGFIVNVYLKTLYVTFISLIPPSIIASYLHESLLSLLTICVISIITTVLTIYFIGCNHMERTFILAKLKSLKSRLS